ncbi:hypothetical protein DM01DRAFT_1340996 [Hesseltinella vesiculosa]|uniref:Uncharacterized protein n=1 Tax=Hesseltinella vesiculosa TaxID=101127 RepID=A0A1X2G2D3_9FUNG|nr:hypothetical protein DM01DRAFT_1340996 [Hesseltinella vesiculosa]
MKHIRLAFPGEEKMFTFLPGEEVKAQGRFALERSKAFEEASLKYGKARYIRPKQTPSPLMSDLLKRKGEVMEETKRRHEAQQQAYQEEQARQQAEEQAQEHIQEHIQEEIQEHSQEQAKVHAQ